MAIGDPSGGLLQQIWRCTYVNGQIVLYDSTDTQYPMIAVPGLTWCRFAFDQNMRPVFAYVANGASYYRWYDPIALDYVTVALPVGAVSPCVALDDARSLQIPVSDLIIAYIENDILYVGDFVFDEHQVADSTLILTTAKIMAKTLKNSQILCVGKLAELDKYSKEALYRIGEENNIAIIGDDVDDSYDNVFVKAYEETGLHTPIETIVNQHKQKEIVKEDDTKTINTNNLLNFI